MIKRLISALGLMAALTFTAAPLALAADVVSCDGLSADQCKLVSEDKLNYKSSNNIIWNIVRFIFILLGAVAVIMIIFGGFQYATSQGDSGALSKAKNTILYAVIGLVVALLATGIVSFVIDNIAK